jgi:hypothetical protein
MGPGDGGSEADLEDLVRDVFDSSRLYAVHRLRHRRCCVHGVREETRALSTYSKTVSRLREQQNCEQRHCAMLFMTGSPASE